MRAAWSLCLVVFAVCVIACGSGKKDEAGKGDAKKDEKPVAPEKVKPAGRVTLTQILAEYTDPTKNPNRAAIADKYFGKYWEIDLTGFNYTVQEDHIESQWIFKPGISTTLRFRNKADLLKFTFKDNKPTGPTLVVGKAAAADRFEDCYLP